MKRESAVLRLVRDARAAAVAERNRRRHLSEILSRLATILIRVEPTIITLSLDESHTLIEIGVRNTVSAAVGEVPAVTAEDVQFFEHLLRRYELAAKQMQQPVQ